MIYKAEDGKIAERLFEGWQETLIWSCLQGIAGAVYVDGVQKAASAMAICADFCFFAGRPNEELVRYKPDWYEKDFIIMIPQSNGWAELIERCYPQKARKVTRYATEKDPNAFHKASLEQAAASLPEGYEFRLMNEELYRECKAQQWAADLTGQYKDYGAFCLGGLGVMVLKDGVLAAGASSYSHYLGGIEIEIDTEKSHRRKGLAYSCGARLILECLERNLYPSWDAQNLWSLALSEKLGYHYSHSYMAYEISGY